MATIKDVAERASVSTATVSYVLNGTGTVTDATRQRVLAAAAALSYQPNHAARSLRSRSRTLGLVLPPRAARLSDPAMADLVDGLAEAAAARGYFLLLANASDEQPEELLGEQLLRSGRVDGLVLLDLRADDARVRHLLTLGAPIICAGPPQSSQGCPCVGLDSYGGARAATSHLLSLGHRLVAQITPPSDLAESELFFQGYADALAEAGVELDPSYTVESGATQDDGMAAMQELLALPEPPTAVFAASDTLAFGAMHALRDAGIEVGRAISLVGCGDAPLAAHTHPPLTTLRAPRHALGLALAARLISQVERQPSSPDAALGMQLIVRRSTAPLRCDSTETLRR
ncbi:LacI family transcriptional regulator [Chloroflexales bacterium ZM16-3]|nr:LacI family transcriptional regulator [Chloroflexales bacterium ZM16-3]